MLTAVLVHLVMVQGPYVPGVWKAHFTVVESNFKKNETQAFRRLIRGEVARQNARSWAITFTSDHTYSLPGEQGIWSVKGLILSLKASKKGGKLLKKPRTQAYQIDKSGKSFGLSLRPEMRLDFTKIAG